MIPELMKKLEQERFWGQLTIKYQGGRVELVRQEQSIKVKETDSNEYRNR